MIRKVHLLLCAIGLSVTAGARAEINLIEDLKSPVTTDAKWILITGTGLTLATVAGHSSIFAPFETKTVDEKPLGKYSKYGDALGQWVPNVLYAGGMAASKYWGDSSLGYYRAILMLEATAYAGLVTVVLKYTTFEPRPNDSRSRVSFPSGHSATAFAFAGVVAAEHGWWYGVPAMMLAGFVGYSRINDNQHHVHDVVAGATIGLSCAYGIYYAHQEEKKSLSGSSARPQLVPIALPEGGAELVALWGF